VRVVTKVRARVEPNLEDLAQAFGAEVDATALVYEAGDRDSLFAEGTQQLLRHRANSGKVALLSAVAAARQIVDRNRYLARAGNGGCVQKDTEEEPQDEPDRPRCKPDRESSSARETGGLDEATSFARAVP